MSSELHDSRPSHLMGLWILMTQVLCILPLKGYIFFFLMQAYDLISQDTYIQRYNIKSYLHNQTNLINL